MGETLSFKLGMRAYVLGKASRMRKTYGRVDAKGLADDALSDPVFCELWNKWRRQGCKKGDAPSFLVDEDRWVTTREKLHYRWRSRQEKGEMGVSRTPSGSFRVRLYLDGRVQCFGTFKSKEEALEAVRKARKTL